MIARNANKVYSENTDVNLAANSLTKRSWTEGFTFASWICGIAWICLAVSFFLSGPDLPGVSYVIYTVLLFLAVAVLLLFVGSAAKKRQEILDADASPCYTDDDEYWKLGWYNNPDDHHLFVQNRFNSLNYSLNFGRPGAKVFMAAFTAAIIALVIWIFSAIISLSNTEVIFTINNQTCQFEASGYECTFDPDEILSVELTDSLPADTFTRTNGASTEKVNIGHFRGKETGKCMMFLYKNSSPVLEIRLDDMTIFANSSDSEITRQWYTELTDYIH